MTEQNKQSDTPVPAQHTVGPITYDEVEEIILSTEPPGLSDRDDQIWTRRMAVALADLFNSRLNPSPETRALGPNTERVER